MNPNTPTTRHSSGARILRLIAATVLAAAAATQANAAVYFTDVFELERISRANNDSTNVDLLFVSGQSLPRGLAVDDTYIYWASGAQAIGRAKLDGSEIEPRFIETGGRIPAAVYVNATHVYWTNANDDSLGRADLNGSSPNLAFITGASIPNGITGDATYIYWTNRSSGTIGRATLDGLTVEQNFLTGIAGPAGVAVNDTHLYWSANDQNKIGRSAIDGTSVEADFLTGLARPYYLALDDTYLYWAQSETGFVARAMLDGSLKNTTFINGGGYMAGIAVDDLEVPPDPAAFCPELPGDDCEEFAGDGQLSIVAGSSPKTKVSLKKGTVTADDFGAPTLINGTSFRLCIYVDDLLAVEAGATAGDPGFKLKPDKILTYKNASAAGALSAIKMKVGGGNGLASATAADAPPLPLTFTTALTADLRSSEGCFTKTWTADQVVTSSGTKFIAK